ncbi:MAG: polyribonucleotide nucleotidyltransferase, partial [Pseudomonadota bacterium]
MFEKYSETIDFGGRDLVLETGQIARQADGAILASYGQTKVLCTAVVQKRLNPEASFFPLAVHYQERSYAAGKIPGGFFKREGRPSEKETLTSRLIDRPIRPLFPDHFKNEVQIICTVLQHDLDNNPDIVAMIGASAALMLSGAPFSGPIAGARIGYKDDAYILNPTTEEQTQSELDLVIAGTKDGVLMVESEAAELSEEVLLGAINFGHEKFQPIIDAILSLAKKVGVPSWYEPVDNTQDEQILDYIKHHFEQKIASAYQKTVKQQRQQILSDIRAEIITSIVAQHQENPDFFTGNESSIYELIKSVEADYVRKIILEKSMRIDGRNTSEIRPISTETGILERAHGTALFTRGETQALVVATLGTGQDEQIVDALEGEYRQNFMLHYNFPPYSVGETGRMLSPGRREIGHGKLAWRAIRPLLPNLDDFPYTIRLVSEVTESNGSSSMATVCGSSIALMDAGVQLKRPCAGIAMGLIKQGEKFAILSDILGDEDHLGDMDFKVAGSEKGITALQMDIKITSITSQIMQQALQQAHVGRKHILNEMAKTIDLAREEISQNAPRITTIQIAKEKIRDVIGSGGKVIRELCATTGAKIDLNDDGTVKIAAVNADAVSDAIERIQAIVAEPEAGRIYHGKVVKIMDFGAFVNFLGTRDGLVHISELAPHHVKTVQDIVQEGNEVYVKCLGVDDRGKTRLSMRCVDQTTGEEIPDDRPNNKTSNQKHTHSAKKKHDSHDSNKKNDPTLAWGRAADRRCSRGPTWNARPRSLRL